MHLHRQDHTPHSSSQPQTGLTNRPTSSSSSLLPERRSRLGRWCWWTQKRWGSVAFTVLHLTSVPNFPRFHSARLLPVKTYTIPKWGHEAKDTHQSIGEAECESRLGRWGCYLCDLPLIDPTEAPLEHINISHARLMVATALLCATTTPQICKRAAM